MGEWSAWRTSALDDASEPGRWLGIISLVWVVVGFSLAFGDDIGGVIGNPMTFLMFGMAWERRRTRSWSMTIPLIVFAMFQLKFAIITPALITGSFAERVRFSSYLLFIVLFSLFIYAPLAHWTWHPDGIFYKWGVKDQCWRNVRGAYVGGIRRALGRRDDPGTATQPRGQ